MSDSEGKNGGSLTPTRSTRRSLDGIITHYRTSAYDNTKVAAGGKFNQRLKAQAIEFWSLSTSALIAFETRFLGV
jgi:hypothetical protein